MKTILLALTGLCLFALSSVAQTVHHPIIENVKASYRSQPMNAGNGGPSSGVGIQVKNTVTIELKPGADAVKIYLKVSDKQSGSVIYQADYPFSSSVVEQNGVQLFKKEGDTLSLSNPALIPLKPYLYEISTEDASGVRSSVYTIIQ